MTLDDVADDDDAAQGVQQMLVVGMEHEAVVALSVETDAGLELQGLLLLQSVSHGEI